jgi:Sugar (and other) transporter
MIFGNGICALTMLVMGSIYAGGGDASKAGQWTIIAMIYLFLVSFSLTTAVVCRLYVTEINPIKTRAAVSSLAQSANWVCSACL